jgi:TRIAD3 protein (E3 ubiquitin-protein ligase RNF216)
LHNNKSKEIIEPVKKIEYIPLYIDGLTECQCCYTEYDFKEMITCSKACNEFKHVFCKECIKGYIESGISDNKSNINCMINQDCNGIYTLDNIQKCITDEKTLNQLNDIIQINDSIEMSKILDNYYTCPFCQKYGCIADNIQYIECKRCNKEWCTLCKMEKHGEFKCGKINDKKNIDAIRQIVSETLTNALTHKCPKCSTKYIKEDGCNKMTCPTCGSYSCYICNILIKPIDGKYYYHFIGSGSYDKKNGSSCPLYNGTSQDKGNSKYNNDKLIKSCNELLSVNTDDIKQIMLNEMKKLNVPIEQLNYKIKKINVFEKSSCCIM